MNPDEHRALVILVEEEPDQRRAIADMLDRAGFAVLGTETTDQGLRLLDAKPDARGLVTDAHVPGAIDGWELAQRARALRPDLAVVLMSGHSDPTSGFLPEGAAFLLKPNVPANLATTLEAMLAQA